MQWKISDLESKALTYQMNPHFIFNSLNTVQQFILEKEEEQGLNYLTDFSMLMRQILENSRKPSITLFEELDFLERYLQLERIRFSNSFDYFINVHAEISKHEIKIPPVFIQPLLENAIKHGIRSIKGKGIIRMEISVRGDFLICIIEDNGTGIYAEKRERSVFSEKKESTALKVIEERLKLTRNNYGETGKMMIKDKSESSGQTGTLIEIHIPILT